MKGTRPGRAPIVGVSRWKTGRGTPVAGPVGGGGWPAHRPAPRHAKDPEAAARRAGDRGRSAEPKDHIHRRTNYYLQTGRTSATDKQRRRMEKKARRASKLAELRRGQA